MLRVKAFIPGNRVGLEVMGTALEVIPGEVVRVEVERVTECRVDGWPKTDPDNAETRAWLREIGMLSGEPAQPYTLAEAEHVEVLGVAPGSDQIGLFGGD